MRRFVLIVCAGLALGAAGCSAPGTQELAQDAVQAMGDRAAPAQDDIAALPERVNKMPPRAEGYVGRLLAKLREDHGAKANR